MKELKPVVEDLNSDYEKASQEGDKSNLVEVNRIKHEAAQAIRALEEIEEQISDEMKLTLQRQVNMIPGRNLSEEEV
jgi:hypothetical protein